MEPELNPALLAEVCRAFRLGPATSVTYLRDGRVNDSFLVRTPVGAYVVRRSKAERTTGAVEFEHDLMIYLAERGFRAPPLRTTIGGGTFLTIEGHIYRATTFVQGERCSPHDATHLRVCAQTLAHYHRLVADYGLPSRPGFVPILDELLAGLSSLPSRGECLPSPQPTDNWFDPLRTHLVATCVKLAQPDPPQAVVVHASCRRGSFVLLKGQTAAMLDYDNAHVDARALDVAIALLSFASIRPGKTALDLDRAAAFVGAYTVVAPISEAELDLISWYMRARVLKRALARYRHYRAVPHPSRAAKLRRATSLLRWLEEHEEALRSTMTRVAEATCA